MVGNNLVAPGFVPPSSRSRNLKNEPRTLILLSVLSFWAQFRTVASGVRFRFVCGRNTNSPTAFFHAPVGFPFLAFSLHPRSYENHVHFWKLSEESCRLWQHCVMKAASVFWAGLVQVQYRPSLKDSLWSHWLSWLPSTPKVGGTTVQQLCRKEFAKSHPSFPLLLVMCSQRWGAFVL